MRLTVIKLITNNTDTHTNILKQTQTFFSNPRKRDQ